MPTDASAAARSATGSSKWIMTGCATPTVSLWVGYTDATAAPGSGRAGAGTGIVSTGAEARPGRDGSGRGADSSPSAPTDPVDPVEPVTDCAWPAGARPTTTRPAVARRAAIDRYR